MKQSTRNELMTREDFVFSMMVRAENIILFMERSWVHIDTDLVGSLIKDMGIEINRMREWNAANDPVKELTDLIEVEKPKTP